LKNIESAGRSVNLIPTIKIALRPFGRTAEAGTSARRRSAMPPRKPSDDALKEREKLAQELRIFMQNNKFTEKKFGEIVGISRRTVQMIKAGAISPHESTLEKMNTLFTKYRNEGK
jgi:DNA-binding XRE family transcriptional regulator